MTLLKDLLHVHEDSLKEKNVQPDATDDKMVSSETDIDDKEKKPAADNFTISMDESLFMRLMEFAREEVKNDIQLHKVVNQIEVLMGDNDCLTMDHYKDIVGEKAEEEPEEEPESEDEPTPPADEGNQEEE